MIEIINFTDFDLSDRDLQYEGRAGEKEEYSIMVSIGF